ncbi:hypothetical protein HNQ59_003274 [Chitinivorax tropicus]|uniref:UPF0250 protein HNQ59_003274 n=1 Tax=Chitinivorax tropicus TaxID=714531 RepID=A0A840MUB8_9PROT|nr:DUF493 domain-containing protein [Chitinivorax tropicus]MBB5019966.1 hypothetical protein [Chitinivorax tropicus]
MSQQQETLIEFPCRFPIKVMGVRTEDFAQIIHDITLQHAPDFTASDLEMRVSKNGNYLSVTVTINAVSKQQLDTLYLAFTGHPAVKVVF